MTAGVVLVASLVALGAAGCQGASRETLAAAYEDLASTANAASAPLTDSLTTITAPAMRQPILRSLAGIEKTFGDGVAALPASGDIKAAADEVVRLTRAREAAYSAAAEATGAAAQAAALAPIVGAGGDAFHAAVERLRSLLGLPSVDTSPAPGSPAPSPSASA